MKIYTLKCTNCGAALEIEDGIDTFFCKYCGYKLILAEMSESSIHAKVQLKKIEHQERMKDKYYGHERYKMEKDEIIKGKEKKRKFIISVIGISLFILFYISFFGLAKMESIREERQLEELVDEIMLDLDNGDYEEAYLKTNKLYYTSDWSSEIEDKWDETREALLKLIKKAEREEDGGIFHWFK